MDIITRKSPYRMLDAGPDGPWENELRSSDHTESHWRFPETQRSYDRDYPLAKPAGDSE